MMPSLEANYRDWDGNPYDKRSVPIMFSLDIDGWESVEFLRAGAYANYARHQHDDFVGLFGTTYSNLNFNSLGFGLRASMSLSEGMYHLLDTEIGLAGFDVYLGFQGGYEWILGTAGTGEIGIGRTIRTSPFGGIRFLIANKIGVYGEFGRTAYGLVNFGLTADLFPNER